MPKHLSWKELVGRLRKLGFDGPFCGGKHFYMRKDGFNLPIPNPHRGDVSAQLISKIVRDSGLRKEDWNDLEKQ